MRFANAASATGGYGLSINCRVRFFVFLHPVVVVLNCRWRVSKVRFVFPPGCLHACSVVVWIHTFVETAGRGHLVRSIVIVAVNRLFCRFCSQGSLCVQGTNRFCL